MARHAKASKIEVMVDGDRDTFLLHVKDDGIGISDNQISNSKSLGLIGMRERALRLGGEVVINKNGEKGTQLTVRIPLHAKG